MCNCTANYIASDFGVKGLDNLDYSHLFQQEKAPTYEPLPQKKSGGGFFDKIIKTKPPAKIEEVEDKQLAPPIRDNQPPPRVRPEPEVKPAVITSQDEQIAETIQRTVEPTPTMQTTSLPSSTPEIAQTGVAPSPNSGVSKKGFLGGLSIWEGLFLIGIGLAIFFVANKYLK